MRNAMLHRLSLWIAYAAVRTTLAVLRVLPFGAARALCLGASRLFYALDARHRDIALVNLRLAFPEKDEAWRRRVARGSFENFGLMVAEIAHLGDLTPGNIREHVAFDENYAIYTELKKLEKGCFYVTGHVGNWELLAHAHALVGRPFHAVVRPLDNPLLDDYLEKFRTSTGNRIIDKKHGGAKAMIAALRRNEDVGILIDQYSRRSKGVYAPLFGVEASTTAGMAVMALRTGAPMIPVFVVRDPGRMKFRVLIFPPVEAVRTGDQKEDVRLTTANINRALETMIRLHPDHWLWAHRRWKNSPDIEGNLYRGGRIVRRNGEPVPAQAARGGRPGAGVVPGVGRGTAGR
jgi:KDO2-lipid IV(A) lauroyltransferase